MIKSSEDGSSKHAGWGNHSWFYIVVRISLFLWVHTPVLITYFLFVFLMLKLIVDLNNSFHLKVALLNLITISSTWARVIDVMDSEV